MAAYGSSRMTAYKSVAVQGAVTNADPHGLVQMVMDGTLQRLNTALHCIEHGDLVRKSKMLHSCVTLLTELRGNLNYSEGGELAVNLGNLYEYMTRRVMLGNLNNDSAVIREVQGLLEEIRNAWVAIGPQVRGGARPAA